VRAAGYRAAVAAALDLATPGDVVLVLYEKMDAMLGLLGELGAVPAEAVPVGALRA
jgi:cyanophycin synthetase